MRFVVLAFVVTLTSVAVVAADQPGAAQTDISALTWSEYSQQGILSTLELDHDLWLEAQLGGDHDQVARIEKELLGLINRDIFGHQERVREIAKDMVLSSVPGPDSAAAPAASDSLQSRVDFKGEIDILNAKEALCRSFRRTDAFSNKYRLLGDYIDLLRRELEMPRLKMAITKAPADTQAVDKTTPPDQK
jgi:hypothetical protein